MKNEELPKCRHCGKKPNTYDNGDVMCPDPTCISGHYHWREEIWRKYNGVK